MLENPSSLVIEHPTSFYDTQTSERLDKHFLDHVPDVMANSRPFVLIFVLFLIIALGRQFLPTSRSPVQVPVSSMSPDFSPYSTASLPQQWRIEGRWKSIHASLGLPPRPGSINIPFPSTPLDIPRASRFDLKRRRAIEDSLLSRAQVQLYFSPEALEGPSVSLEALTKSFLAAALVEKETVEERTRERLQRERQISQRRS